MGKKDNIISKCFANKFTLECDEWRTEPCKKAELRTYLVEIDHDAVDDPGIVVYAIRLPGATRGSVWIRKESKIIKSIYFDSYCSFSKEIGCYDERIVPVMRRWIGRELV